MFKEVSESETGQDRPPPSRKERDEAFSSGAGRKAVEVPLEEDLHKSPHTKSKAPVGLELETQAHEFTEE